jgi:hypothetical protein
MGRKKYMLDGVLRGRNELIQDSIYRDTGISRDRKQVSSHLQVLKEKLKGLPAGKCRRSVHAVPTATSLPLFVMSVRSGLSRMRRPGFIFRDFHIFECLSGGLLWWLYYCYSWCYSGGLRQGLPERD